eukprot:Platyproteum_vivax@DN7039_c0_g1_i1.p2
MGSFQGEKPSDLDVEFVDEVEEDEDGMLDNDDIENLVEVEDMATVSFVEHNHSVCAVDISPANCDVVASGGMDDHAFIWNSRTGAQVHDLAGHTDTVSAVKFSHDGVYVATGGYDGSVKVWVTSSGGLVGSLEGPTGEIEWLDWHPRGHALVAGSGDFNLWMWWAPTGKVRLALPLLS